MDEKGSADRKPSSPYGQRLRSIAAGAQAAGELPTELSSARLISQPPAELRRFLVCPGGRLDGHVEHLGRFAVGVSRKRGREHTDHEREDPMIDLDGRVDALRRLWPAIARCVR